MAIEEMELLDMTFDKKHLKEVLCQLKETKYFYPQPATKIVNNVKDVFTMAPDEDYKNMLDELTTLSNDIKLDVSGVKEGTYDFKKEDYRSALDSIKEEVKKYVDIKNEFLTERGQNQDAYEILNGLSNTEINMDDVKDCEYMTARFGRIPRRNKDKLDYYKGQSIMFLNLGEDAKSVYCLYMTTKAAILKVDNIFQSVGFEEIEVPDFVHGKMEDAKKELLEEIEGMNASIRKADSRLEGIRDAHKEELLKMYANLSYASRIEEFKVFVVDYQSKYAIYGFIPTRLAKEIKKDFEKYGMEYQDLPAHIYDDQHIVAPTLTNNYPWAKPFEVISKVKQSDHVDTTLATAVLFIIVFALMLGDIGLGIVLFVLGLLMRKKESGKMLTILGIASFVGGLLYGDAFYTINLYPSVIPVSDAFSYQRFINALLLLIVGQFCIGKVKAIYNEESMINKVFSIKGVVGIVMGLAVAAYVAIAVDTAWHVSYLPLVVVLVLGIVLNFIKRALDKKQ